METYNKIMEKVWLFGGLFSAIMIVYMNRTEGEKEWPLWWLVFPAICLAMYTMRRFMRKRMEKFLEYKATQEVEKKV